MAYWWLAEATSIATPPPPPPPGERAAFEYVHFDVAWMVATDQNASGQIQWVEYPWDVAKRLEDMYMDPSKGVDDSVE